MRILGVLVIGASAERRRTVRSELTNRDEFTQRTRRASLTRDQPAAPARQRRRRAVSDSVCGCIRAGGAEAGRSAQATAACSGDDARVSIVGTAIDRRRAESTMYRSAARPCSPIPRDPKSGMARKRNPVLNQVLFAAVCGRGIQTTRTQGASPSTAMVAYSGVCTHTGCSVSRTGTRRSRRTSCARVMASQFDPRDGSAHYRRPRHPAPAAVATTADQKNDGASHGCRRIHR